MFGFIKKLINGIFAFLAGLFNKKSAADGAAPQPARKSGYFMELDDAPANGQPAKTEAAKAEPVKAQPAKAEAAKVEAPKAPEPASQPAKAEAKKPAKAEPVKTEAAPAPAPVANSQNGQKPAEPAIAFSSFGDRRRPGPNMSSFLDMARQVKVPT